MRRRLSIPALLALLLALLACGWLALQVRSSRWVMDADEAVHAVEALRLYDRLEQGQLGRFLVDSYLPERWQPPVQDHVRWYGIVHAWSLLPAFALLGPGDLAARLPSVLYLFGACALVFLLARALAPSAGDWSGLIAVLLLLTAPNLVTFAPQCLTETCSLFWCLAALLGYVRFVERPESRGRAIAAGTLLAVAILSKYDHGLLLLCCLGVAELVRARGRPLSLLRSNAAWMLGVAILSFGAWIAHPAKLAAFRDTLAHPAYGSWRVIAANFAASWVLEYTSSLGTLLLVLAGFVAAARRLSDPRVRGVWLYAGLSALILLLRARFRFRYNLVEVPAFFVLAAAWLPDAARRWSTGRAVRPARQAAALLAAGLAVLLALFLAERHSGALESAISGLTRGLFALLPSRLGLSQGPEFYAHGLLAALRRMLILSGWSVLGLGAALLALGAWQASGLSRRAGVEARRAAWIVALAIGTVPGALSFWRQARAMIEWEWEGVSALHEIVRSVAAETPPKGRILLGGGWDQMTNNTLQWHLATEYLRPRPVYDELAVVGDMIGSIVLPEAPRIQHWAEVLRSAPRAELPERVVLIDMLDWFVYGEEVGPEVPLYRAILEQRGAYDRIAGTTIDELGAALEIWARREAEVAALVEPRGEARRGPLSYSGRRTAGRWTVGDKAWRQLANPWLR